MHLYSIHTSVFNIKAYEKFILFEQRVKKANGTNRTDQSRVERRGERRNMMSLNNFVSAFCFVRVLLVVFVPLVSREQPLQLPARHSARLYGLWAWHSLWQTALTLSALGLLCCLCDVLCC